MEDKQQQLKHLHILQLEYEAMIAITHDREEQWRLYDMLREIVRDIEELEKR
jgi:hypothetical protein